MPAAAGGGNCEGSERVASFAGFETILDTSLETPCICIMLYDNQWKVCIVAVHYKKRHMKKAYEISAANRSQEVTKIEDIARKKPMLFEALLFYLDHS